MDIHSWLQNTADRQPPGEEDHPGFPDFLKPPRPQEPTRREKHRKRKRASSEPPSSERHHHRRKRHQAATCSSASSDHRRQLQPAAASSRSSSYESEDFHARDTPADDGPGKSFERRARHKTRPDRYDVKLKKRSKGRDAHGDRNSKSKRRKSHQSADVARAAGKISSFQLKNGRKDKRLTLRPDFSAGIFKHGRSSAPVALNSPGLPDLVFNEMRFLQRPTEHQDEIPRGDADAKQSKKSKQQLREEEISAYFAKKPPAENTFQRGTNDRPVTQRANVVDRENQEQPRRRPRKVDLGPIGSPVELPEKPFLGFGSKGPSRESNAYYPESNTHHPTSYFTWSESVVGNHHTAPMRRQIENVDHNRRHQAPFGEGVSSLPKQPSPGARQCGRTKQSKPRDEETSEQDGRWVESRRGKGPSGVEIYQPPNNPRPPTKRRAGRVTTHTSSESLPKAQNGAVDDHQLDHSSHAEIRDYRTSDVLKIRDDHQTAGPSSMRQAQYESFEDKENRSRSGSTPISDLLRRAFHAVTNLANDKPTQTARVKTSHRRQTEGDHERRHVNILDTGYRPASHARRNHSTNTSNATPQMLPQRGFSRSTEAPRAQQRQPLQTMPASTTNIPQRWRPPPTRGDLRGKFVMEDDEMLDNIPSGQPLTSYHHYTGGREVEDLVHRLNAGQESQFLEQTATPSGRFEADFGHPGIDEDFYVPFNDTRNTSLSTGDPLFPAYPAVKEYGNGMQDEQPDDHMDGFWRPNVLY